MTDQETPDNPTKPECAVTLVLLPAGHGIQIQPVDSPELGRVATISDLEAISGQLQTWLLAQRLAGTIGGVLAQQAPKVVTPRGGFRMPFGRS
jgi:hypothetical protein